MLRNVILNLGKQQRAFAFNKVATSAASSIFTPARCYSTAAVATSTNKFIKPVDVSTNAEIRAYKPTRKQRKQALDQAKIASNVNVTDIKLNTLAPLIGAKRYVCMIRTRKFRSHAFQFLFTTNIEH